MVINAKVVVVIIIIIKLVKEHKFKFKGHTFKGNNFKGHKFFEENKFGVVNNKQVIIVVKQ